MGTFCEGVLKLRRQSVLSVWLIYENLFLAQQNSTGDDVTTEELQGMPLGIF